MKLFKIEPTIYDIEKTSVRKKTKNIHYMDGIQFYSDEYPIYIFCEMIFLHDSKTNTYSHIRIYFDDLNEIK